MMFLFIVCIFRLSAFNVLFIFHHPLRPTASLSSCVVQNTIHQNIYGKSLAITNTEAQLSTTIIENPEMLKYQQERQNSAQANAAAAAAAASTGPESSAPKVNSMMNGESLEDIRKVNVT